MQQVLVSADDLVEEMLSDRPPVVLDIRWSLRGADHEGFRSGHIPGALFVDLDAELAADKGDGTGGRHPLPTAAQLQVTWRRVGINLGDAVVVYDARDSSAAARAWWLLRWSGVRSVRVLDGGLAAWAAAGLRVKAGDGTPNVPGGFRVRVPTADADLSGTVGAAGSAGTAGTAGSRVGSAILDADTAADYAAGPDTVLVDARGAARFRGEVEPMDPVAGHIPGAVNLPFTELLEPDGTFKSAADLRRLFADVGIEPGTRVGASCGSGVTACHVILGGAAAGIDIDLFPGSWSAWCALERPVETGPARTS